MRTKDKTKDLAKRFQFKFCNAWYQMILAFDYG
jgi:hypothetical protein